MTTRRSSPDTSQMMSILSAPAEMLLSIKSAMAVSSEYPRSLIDAESRSRAWWMPMLPCHQNPSLVISRINFMLTFQGYVPSLSD